MECRRFCIYGAATRIHNFDDVLGREIDRALKPFSVRKLSGDGIAVTGTIKPYDYTDVARYLSPVASAVGRIDPFAEIHAMDEHYWLTDERWGLCEINLLRHCWRSWLLPRPSLDAVALVEAAVIWPMSQLLRPLGVELLPAVAIERNGWGALILAPYSIGSELLRLVRAGYRVIGQRWTALRRQNHRLILAHLPGVIEDPACAHGGPIGTPAAWIDLSRQNPWCAAEIATCDAVFIVEPGRRSKTRGRILPAADALASLRHAWPMVELPLSRPRARRTAATIARESLCLSVQLSRQEEEFLQLVEFSRHRCASKVEVSIHSALRRHVAPAGRQVASLRRAG